MRCAVFSITLSPLFEVRHISMEAAQSWQVALLVAMWLSMQHLSERTQQPVDSHAFGKVLQQHIFQIALCLCSHC